MIVLDTNVVSELMRPSPAPEVVGWVRRQATDELRTTAISVAEIAYGIERLPDGRRRQLLRRTADEVFENFDEQVLPFDNPAALRYGQIVSARERIGRPIDGFDAQIAAICRAHGAALATRNGNDFEHTGVAVLDPWRELV